MRERPPYLIWPLDGIKLILTFVALVIVFASVLTQKTTSAQPRPLGTPAASPTRVVVATPTAIATATQPPAATKPTTPTIEPIATLKPAVAPTKPPTSTPRNTPTVVATATPQPTQAPTSVPTQAPTLAPTVAPTQAPTLVPTQEPTVVPTVAPATATTSAPTAQPTGAAGTFAITLPEPGATLRTPRPIFIGVGRAGDTVTVMDGQVILGTTTIDARGRWRFVTPQELAAGDHTINFQVKNGQGELQGEMIPLKIIIAP
jgi:hypothetical protein